MSQPAPSGDWPDPSSPPTQIGAPDPHLLVPPGSPPAAPPGAAPVGPPPAYPAGSYGAPAAPPPGFGYPAYGPYGYPPPPKTNGMSIAALVVSIIGAVSLCGYGIGGLIGIVGAILGHVARRQVRERGEGGEGMALAGIIVGWISFGIGVLIIGAIIVAIVIAATA